MSRLIFYETTGVLILYTNSNDALGINNKMEISLIFKNPIIKGLVHCTSATQQEPLTKLLYTSKSFISAIKKDNPHLRINPTEVYQDENFKLIEDCGYWTLNGVFLMTFNPIFCEPLELKFEAIDSSLTAIVKKEVFVLLAGYQRHRSQLLGEMISIDKTTNRVSRQVTYINTDKIVSYKGVFEKTPTNCNWSMKKVAQDIKIMGVRK